MLPLQVRRGSLLGAILSWTKNSSVHLFSLLSPLLSLFLLHLIELGVGILSIKILYSATIAYFKSLLATLFEGNNLLLLLTFTLIIFEILFLDDVK